MNRNDPGRWSGLLWGLVAAVVLTGAAQAQQNLQVQTSSKSGDFEFQYLTDEWAPRIEALTGGALSFEFLPTGAVMPRTETPDGVAAGVLSGDMTSVEYFSGRDPAFAIMGNLIAGYDSPDQVQTFCRHGGGREMLQKLWDEMLPGKLHVIGCGAVSREALVSAVPIRGVDDLKGVKIRSPEGLAATVFQKAGASPVNMSINDVFTALEKGVIEAADASAYINNSKSGYHQIAAYPIYPGIHSMTVRQFTLNKDLWDGLTADQQVALETWFYAAYDDLRRVLDLQDKEVVAAEKADEDITVIDWPQSERDRFRQIATEAWEETASKSPLAREALETHYEFMKTMGLL